MFDLQNNCCKSRSGYEIIKSHEIDKQWKEQHTIIMFILSTGNAVNCRGGGGGGLIWGTTCTCIWFIIYQLSIVFPSFLFYFWLISNTFFTYLY